MFVRHAHELLALLETQRASGQPLDLQDLFFKSAVRARGRLQFPSKLAVAVTAALHFWLYQFGFARLQCILGCSGYFLVHSRAIWSETRSRRCFVRYTMDAFGELGFNVSLRAMSPEPDGFGPAAAAGSRWGPAPKHPRIPLAFEMHRVQEVMMVEQRALDARKSHCGSSELRWLRRRAECATG